MNFYGLLIGINSYNGHPLTLPVYDVKQMKIYLESIKDKFENFDLKILLEEEATRENIIIAIQTQLYQASDSDVAVLYYSGHGAQEKAQAGIFPDEHDCLLECMVCWSEGAPGTESLLTNKEIRYLLSNMKNSPHLVTIFDCCHSGDIVRTASKNIDGIFPQRQIDDYIFAEDEAVIVRKDGEKTFKIPFKESIHMAACQSSEKAYEGPQGSIFTYYLLHLLNHVNHDIDYIGIVKWAKLSLPQVTGVRQTPTIRVQGNDDLNQYSSWLKLSSENTATKNGIIHSHPTEGLIYSKGSLLGVKVGMEVFFTLDGREEQATVSKVDMEFSTIELSLHIINRIDFQSTYEAWTPNGIYEPLVLYFNNFDRDVCELSNIISKLSEYDKIIFSDSNDTFFHLNYFADKLYFTTKHESSFQPFAKQLEVKNNALLWPQLHNQLQSIIKWNHFYTLENLDYDKIPIKIEIQIDENGWIDVTGTEINLIPENERYKDIFFYKEYKIRVTNISEESLFVAALILNSDMSISSKALDNISVELKPKNQIGSSKIFFDHINGLTATTLDIFKEVYNWQKERHYFKFLFNNYEDFSTTIQDHNYFSNLPLESPTSLDINRSNNQRLRYEFNIKANKWGTCLIPIKMINPIYNKMSREIQAHLSEDKHDTSITPFLRAIY